MVLARIDIRLYRFFLREDGPVEWAQFNAFAIACLAGAGIALRRFTLWPESSFTITKYSEWAEFCLAFGLCVFRWLNFRRLSTAAAPTAWRQRSLILMQKAKLLLYGLFNRNSN